jgi:hypothetical protein
MVKSRVEIIGDAPTVARGPQRKLGMSTHAKAAASTWVTGEKPKGRAAIYDVSEIRALARKHTVEAMSTLIEIMSSSSSDQARIHAAEIVLDRGWGRVPTAPEPKEKENSDAPEVSQEEREARIANILSIIQGEKQV